jgi:hypothetical protein
MDPQLWQNSARPETGLPQAQQSPMPPGTTPETP